MYTIQITAKGQTSGGKPIPVGTIIKHPEAWRHCLRGFRNADPIAEPADDVTREKVGKATATRDRTAAANKAHLQSEVNRLAKKLPLDDDGNFKRTSAGKISKATAAEVNLIETAEAYGITPEVAAA